MLVAACTIVLLKAKHQSLAIYYSHKKEYWMIKFLKKENLEFLQV